MKKVTPSCHIVGSTQVNAEGFAAMLDEIGVPEWTTDAESGTELLIESAGKLCYMSFDTKLNENLTKVGTRNNFDYIQQGLIATKHGSVLEHGTVNLVFLNVSRVLTHELVRHRAGAAYSQTSGRYVRFGELSFWIPSCIAEHPELERLFIEAVENQERTLAQMVEVSGINNMTGREDFELKKELTSAFRRIIGNGVANNIMATYNHRALRHLIPARTSRHAEEEIRIAFADVFAKLNVMFPAIYADHKIEMVKGLPEIVFLNEKV
jgi:thymidylate synthase (FAD)